MQRPVAERLALLVERTARLHRLTARLSTALHASEVAAIVVDEGTEALGAHSGALWRVDSTRLALVRAKNYPPAAITSVQQIPLDPSVPVADAVLRGEPVWLSSRADYEARYPDSAARTRTFASLPEYSVAALPIALDGQVNGVLVLKFETDHEFDEDERGYLAFLALHCAQGFERARLYESETLARRAAETAHERAHFLSKASAVLGSSLDYEETLTNVARIAVPSIGDWFVVELVDETGVPRQVAVGHIDAEKVEFARELRHRYPPDPNAASGVPNVLRTGMSELLEDIPDERLVARAVDEEHLRIMRELGLRSAIMAPIRDRDSVFGVITFVRASGDRRYNHDDLLMAEQLGERAGAAISNAKLYTQAREAIRARDEFMLIAGHELRTPLAALSLHHEALIRTPDSTPAAKVRERGTKLHAQTEKLQWLVRDLLDVSRISAGRLMLELEELDLGAVVSAIAERMRDEFERAKSPLQIDVEQVHGRWDRGRIDQIVTNLLGNAAKYGKGAPVEVTVRREGERARFEVQDHGIGIAEEDQSRIFKRYERAASPKSFGGLGLGLWIASQLVTAHGGEISVTSKLSQGARFTVMLPLTPPS